MKKSQRLRFHELANKKKSGAELTEPEENELQELWKIAAVHNDPSKDSDDLPKAKPGAPAAPNDGPGKKQLAELTKRVEALEEALSGASQAFADFNKQIGAIAKENADLGKRVKDLETAATAPGK